MKFYDLFKQINKYTSNKTFSIGLSVGAGRHRNFSHSFPK